MQVFKMDEIDHQILEFLVRNSRMPFTEIANQLEVSAGTIHVRVKKMEDYGVIKGAGLHINYPKIGYHIVAFVGINLIKTSRIKSVVKSIWEIPFVTEAHMITGKYNLFCKIRARDTSHAKDIIFKLDDIEGILRTETILSLEENMDDDKRLLQEIFQK